jgi:hypothetical protein
MLATEAKLEAVDATVEVQQGTLGIERTGEADAYVDFPENKPLSTKETHVKLRVVGDFVRAEVELDAEMLDRLADALYHIQGHLQADPTGGER